MDTYGVNKAGSNYQTRARPCQGSVSSGYVTFGHLHAPLKWRHFSVASDPARDGRMKRSRFSNEHIIGSLKQQEPGAATADVCRRHGISGVTFYKWKAKFGQAASDAGGGEEENAKLQKLPAEAMLDIAVLKDISTKKGDARHEAELAALETRRVHPRRDRGPAGFGVPQTPLPSRQPSTINHQRRGLSV